MVISTFEPDDLLSVRKFIQMDRIRLPEEGPRKIDGLAARLTKAGNFRMGSVYDSELVILWRFFNTYEQHIIAESLYTLYPDLIVKHYFDRAPQFEDKTC